MVEFDLTDEQRLLQKTAHEFVEREMRPVALEYDKKGTVPWDIIQKAHAIGLDTAFIPEAYGGGGIDSALTHVIVNEELNWGCAGMATGLIGAGLAYLPIIHMGTEEQKKRFLTRFTGKEARLGALCLTEPDAGSDVANISTTAKKDGDEWVLNGVKRFITNGGVAGIHRGLAKLDKSRAHFGIQAFGTPIAKKQAIAFMLADMKTKIDAARLLTWRAAWMLDQGEPMNKEASIAKLFAADMAMEVTTDAVQILGGAGYMKDEPVEKWMRDAKIFQIWEGTSQIQRLVISREEIGEL